MYSYLSLLCLSNKELTCDGIELFALEEEIDVFERRLIKLVLPVSVKVAKGDISFRLRWLDAYFKVKPILAFNLMLKNLYIFSIIFFQDYLRPNHSFF